MVKMKQEYFKCKICGEEFETKLGVSGHIVRIHNVTIIDYYKKFKLKKECKLRKVANR